jgi:hypothetical protein
MASFGRDHFSVSCAQHRPRSGDSFANACRGGTIVPNVSLSFAKTGKIMKQVWRVCRETAERETERLSSPKTGKIVKEFCRVCRENAELETERLCPDCTRIKAQIRLRFPDAVRRTKATSGECERTGCLCAACRRGTVTRHPLYASDPARADRRDIHLHPRCHELWLEAVKGRPEEA